jgi:proteasome component ECM29
LLLLGYLTSFSVCAKESVNTEAMGLVYSEINSDNNEVFSGACIALAEIVKYGATDVPSGVYAKLLSLAKSHSEVKIQEIALSTLACIMSTSRDKIDDFINLLQNDLSTHKSIELHITIGEALSILCCSLDSPLLIPFSFSKENNGIDKSPLERILKWILDDMIPPVRQLIRKNSCIWLVTILLNCGKEHILLEKLPQIHSTLTVLLGEKDEITQQMASQGMSVLYDLGDKNMKSKLVDSLVNTILQENKESSNDKVEDDTVIFAENSGMTLPDGSAITTYKELLSLASSMNQPDLVYKFMELANNQSVWQMKQASALGFTTILKKKYKHNSHLVQYRKQMVPKLFRYQFDPSPKVREAMRSIWTAFIGDLTQSRKAIDECLNEILIELLQGINNRSWRLREAW